MAGIFDFVLGDDDDAPPAPAPRDLAQEADVVLGWQEKNLPRELDIARKAQAGQADIMQQLYREIIGPMAREETAAGRASDIEQFDLLAPKAAKTILAADPEQAALRAELNRQILEELKAGVDLTPGERQRLQQNVRAAQTARGVGYSPNDASAEALAEYMAGANLRAKRQGRATAMMDANQRTLGDLFMAVTGRPSQSLGVAQGAYSQAAAATPNTDPFGNQYASDLFNTNFNAAYQNRWQQQQADAARYQANAGLFGSLLGAGATVGAAALTPAAMTLV